MKELIGIVNRARERLEDGWTQYAFARDAHGYTVNCRDQRAVSYCLIGAFEAEYILPMDGLVREALEYYAGDKNLGRFNDYGERKKSEVLEVVDKARDRLLLLEKRLDVLRKYKG